MKYLVFVFTVDEINEYTPQGGWFDFVGARDTIEEARACAEDKCDDHPTGNYQIVDLGTLHVVEEGEFWKGHEAISFDERDRREKLLEQSQGLARIGWKPDPPRERFIKYGPYTFDRETGRTVEEDGEVQTYIS